MKDCMLDIETLGQGNNAAVISIGAAMFDPMTGAVGRCFYAVLDPNDPLIGAVDPSTVLWWMSQSEEARKEITDPTDRRLSAAGAMSAFALWCEENGAETLWSNGPTFDEVITRNLAKRCGIRYPIHYRGSRCCRTIAGLAREMGWEPKPGASSLVKHNALDDAVRQVGWVSSAYRFLAGKETA